MVIKIDSNVTGLAFAEETSLKTLPGTPNWYELEPNSYSDFGGDLATVARNPINASRQRKKGTITDLDASGGFNADLTKSNFYRLMQGFMFANAHESFSTQSLNGTQIPITGVTGSNQYSAASGLTGAVVNNLVYASGFANAANNGLKTVTVSATGLLTVAETLVTEASPPAAAKLEVVGYQFPSGDLTMVLSGSLLTLVSASVNLTTLGIERGEWIHVGGDAGSRQFVGNVGYARLGVISAGSLILDKSTFTAASNTGTGKLVQIFWGNVIVNESNSANIVRRTYNLERKLGNDGNGIQSEYLEGAVANELKINVPQADKLNMDLSFVAMNNAQRDGTTGIKAGNRISAPGEDAFNTSSDVYRMKMSVVDPTTLNPSALFAYLTDLSFSVNNNVSPAKAVGVLGAFETNTGTFEVSGSVEAYFATVAATQSVRNNVDVTIDAIFAKKNAGIALDIPLVGLAGGRVTVEQDAPIKIPLDMAAAQNPAGYTLLLSFFPYLPTIAMPL